MRSYSAILERRGILDWPGIDWKVTDQWWTPKRRQMIKFIAIVRFLSDKLEGSRKVRVQGRYWVKAHSEFPFPWSRDLQRWESDETGDTYKVVMRSKDQRTQPVQGSGNVAFAQYSKKHVTASIHSWIRLSLFFTLSRSIIVCKQLSYLKKFDFANLMTKVITIKQYVMEQVRSDMCFIYSLYEHYSYLTLNI